MSKGRCRVMLVTNDSLLATMVEERSSRRENVRVLSDLDETEDLINTLASEATEEYVAGLRESAREMFFISEDRSTLFFAADVLERIKTQYGDKLRSLPPLASRVVHTGTIIGTTSFVQKKRQVVSWTTRCTLTLTAYVDDAHAAPTRELTMSDVLNAFREPSRTTPLQVSFSDAAKSRVTSVVPNTTFFAKGIQESFLEPISLNIARTPLERANKTRTRAIGTTKLDFDVLWHATVSARQKLTKGGRDD